MSKIGIDVSHHDGKIDWDQIASHIDFAIVRVGFGDNVSSQDDKYWARNIEAVERLNIPHGVYIYSYAKNASMAKSEAEHVLRLIKGRTLQMPVYLDLEERNCQSAYKTAWSTFAPIIRNAGYRVGVYIGGSQYDNYFKGATPEPDSLWIPRYGNNTGEISGSKKPNTSANYDLWQYTSNAGRLFPGTTRAGLDVSVMISEKALQINDTTKEEEKENTDFIDNAVEWIKNIAADNSHGYSQKNRDGNPDYDCSSLVCAAYEQAGVPVKSKGGASYTGNMLAGFKEVDFKDVTSSINLSSGTGLIKGDVLLKPGAHTAMYVGNNQVTEASIDEKGGITGSTPGDQTGKEIWTHSYYNYPWTYVLRYTDEVISSVELSGTTLELAIEVMNNKYGRGDTRKAALGNRYEEVQAFINHIFSASVETLVSETLSGKYGSGDARKTILGSRYNEVQEKINAQLSDNNKESQQVDNKKTEEEEKKPAPSAEPENKETNMSTKEKMKIAWIGGDETAYSTSVVLWQTDFCGIIDVGTQPKTQKLISFLKDQGITKINRIMISHWHSDHCGYANDSNPMKGMYDLINAGFDISDCIAYFPHGSLDWSKGSGLSTFKDRQNEMANFLKGKGIDVFYPAEGESVKFGTATMTFHNLTSNKFNSYYNYKIDEWNNSQSNTNYNNFSMIGILDDGDIKVGFPGDIEYPAQVQNYEVFEGVDILTVEHHDLNYKSAEEYLAMLSQARYMVVTHYRGYDQTKRQLSTVGFGLKKGMTIYDTKTSGTIIWNGYRMTSENHKITALPASQGAGIYLESGTDLNDLSNGTYYTQSNSWRKKMKNTPDFNGGFRLEVITDKGEGTRGWHRTQLAYSFDCENDPCYKIAMRQYRDDTGRWGEWQYLSLTK